MFVYLPPEVKESSERVADYIDMREEVVQHLMVEHDCYNVVVDDEDMREYYGDDVSAYFEARDHYMLWRFFFDRYCRIQHIPLSGRNQRLRFHTAALEIYHECLGRDGVAKHCLGIWCLFDEDTRAIFPSCVEALNAGVPLEDIAAGWEVPHDPRKLGFR